MTEFKTHHVVARLVELVGADPALKDRCIETLFRGGRSYGQVSGVKVAKAAIARHCAGSAHEFLKLYDHINAAGAPELDAMVLILSKILADPPLKALLESASVAPAATAPAPVPSAPTTSLSEEDLARLRADLAAASGLAGHGLVQAQPEAGGHSLAAVQPGEAAHAKPRWDELRGLTNRTVRVVPAAIARSQQAMQQSTSPWLYERPFMTADFPAVERTIDPPRIALGTLPLEVQEVAIIDDLLFTMMGVEGKYIRRGRGASDGIGNASSFEVDDTLDPSLRELTERILPLCQAYSNIAHFIDAKDLYGDGLVRQAVSAGVRALIKEYLIVVAQLETQLKEGTLSLQKLWFYVQPCLSTLETLSAISIDIVGRDLKGGALFSMLHERSTAQLGDKKCQQLSQHLAQIASVPYFNMLEQWIYKGCVADPYSEFMVSEDASVNRESAANVFNDGYWEKKYTINARQTPSFLADNAEKILRTGKYLNVIRESGRQPNFPNAVSIVYEIRGRAYANVIDGSFAYASRSLLELLNTDLQLMDQLASIKNYLCMMCGDFFAHFLDTACGDLSKLVRDIEPARLTALLEMALRVSSASSDPFKDNLKFNLVPNTLVTELFRIMNVTHDFQGNERGFVDPEHFQLDAPESMDGTSLKGVDAFTLDYEVRWPVSLVINRKSIKRYQLLFRHLLQCRLVERTLSATWLDDQFFKDSGRVTGATRVAAFALRQRMLNFVQSLQYYSMYEVIEPNWHVMADKLGQASTIDDVLAIHSSFLDTCLKECMLTNTSALKTISKLLSVCDIFGTYNKNIASKVLGAGSERATVVASKKFETSIVSFNDKFTKLMYKLLDTMTEFSASASEQHMSNMVARLDFNGFYTSQRAAVAELEKLKPPGV